MMMPISSIPAFAIASMPKKRTGRLATGTSCLALECVIGRRRVPLPPLRISPLIGRAPELAVVPRRAAAFAELQRDALCGLLLEGGAHLWRRVALVVAIAARELHPDAGDRLDVAVDRRLALEHHAVQLVVDVAPRLHLERAAAVAFEVPDLLRLRVRPRPQHSVPNDVPERHQVRPAPRPEGSARHDPLLLEEVADLVVGHRDRLAPAHDGAA